MGKSKWDDLADILVNYSTQVLKGDRVLVTMMEMDMPTLEKPSLTIPHNTPIPTVMGMTETMSNLLAAIIQMETIPICSQPMARSAKTETVMVTEIIQVDLMVIGSPMTHHNGGTQMAMVTATIRMVH